MDLDGILRHGSGSAHVGGQLFIGYLYFFGGSQRLLFGIRADNSDGVTVLENLGVAKDGTVPAIALVGGEGDQTINAIVPFDVFVGDHFKDTGHLFCCGGVNGEDVGVAEFGLHQGKLQGAGGQFQAQISAVISGAGNLGDRRRAGIGSAPDATVSGKLVIERIRGLVAAHDCGSIHHSIHDGFISCAAAGVEVLLEPGAYIIACGRWILLQ